MTQLLPFRDSFQSSLLETDIDLIDQRQFGEWVVAWVCWLTLLVVAAAAEEKTSLEPDEFVQTVAGNGIEEKKVRLALFDLSQFRVTPWFQEDGSDEKAAAGGEKQKPVRFVKETTPDFMRLPLTHQVCWRVGSTCTLLLTAGVAFAAMMVQGYCPWTIGQRNGLLLLGNPALGIIRCV